MARTVFLHIGLPKTGTTHLQGILWANKGELLGQGILLPGRSSRQHLWASGAVREDPRLRRRMPEAMQAWEQLAAEVNAWRGTALVSHEFFAAATAEQAVRALALLDDDEAPGTTEVHVVLTARETLSLVTARWQEFVKNGASVPVDDYPVHDEPRSGEEWDWGTLDLAAVLERWSAAVPRDRIHVLTLPGPTDPEDALWRRFAGVVGIDPDACRVGERARNESLGLVEVELLRRVNADLEDFGSARDRGVWIRGYLAEGKLVHPEGERFWPADKRVAELTERGTRIAEEVVAGGYHIVGDPAALRPPAQVPHRRHPDDVGEGELLAAATRLIAAMLTDVRALTREKHGLQDALAAVPPPPGPPPPLHRRVLPAVRRRLPAVRRRLPGRRRGRA